jgi:hypothetical protein
MLDVYFWNWGLANYSLCLERSLTMTHKYRRKEELMGNRKRAQRVGEKSYYGSRNSIEFIQMKEMIGLNPSK